MSKLGPGSALRRLSSEPRARIGLSLLGLLVGLSLLAPLLPVTDPAATDLERRLLSPLSADSLLGTDQLGRDLLSRSLYGTRLSLAVAALGTALAATAGTALGLVAAYYGRLVDAVVSRSLEVVLAFPYLLLALSIVAALGPGLTNATLAIAVVNVPFFARTARGIALSLRDQDFVLAARVSGLSDARILFGELLPNALPTLLVAATTTLSWMLIETAGLSFLGLGAQPPTADLGGMLGQSRHLLATAPHLSIVPGTIIFLLAAGLNLSGDALRDALDPKHTRLALERKSPPPPRAVAGQSEPLLSVQELGVAFDGVSAVSDVCFEIAAGEAVALVGESGSGKSVTGQAILGLLAGATVSGSVRVRGEECLGDVARQRDLRGRTLALVPQDPMSSLHPLLRVGTQIVESSVEHGAKRDQALSRARDLLSRMGIADSSAALLAFPHQLSGGMRQRVALALALAEDPALVIADEPTTALDVTNQALVLELLREYSRDRGAALLFVTHDLGIAYELCSRVLVMQKGQLVEAGEIERVFAAPEASYTRALIGAAPRLRSRREAEAGHE